MAALSIHNASVFYPLPGKAAPVHALKDINLDIQGGDFVVALGASGCGKSTLLNLIAGFMSPSQGSITLDGRAVTGPGADRSVVFQKHALLPWLNVLDNIVFPMRHKYGHVSDTERRRAHELLAMVGLEAFATRRPGELSGGMQQRVAIARALLLDPDILLMDEPFSALDALTREEMSFELLRIWTERPKTVLFITHSIPEALLLADRIVVMSARPGRVREILDVPLARPRSLASLSDPAFNEMANYIRGQLFTRPVA